MTRRAQHRRCQSRVVEDARCPRDKSFVALATVGTSGRWRMIHRFAIGPNEITVVTRIATGTANSGVIELGVAPVQRRFGVVANATIQTAAHRKVARSFILGVTT